VFSRMRKGIRPIFVGVALLVGCSTFGNAREPTPKEQKVIDQVLGMAFSAKGELGQREILIDSMIFPSSAMATECERSLPLRQIHEAFGGVASEIFHFSPSTTTISGLDARKNHRELR
jgi:hypothetical protein